MPLPQVQSVLPQSSAQATPFPKTSATSMPGPDTWEHVQRLRILTPASSTAPLGDIVLPIGYNHAMVIWEATDTGAVGLATPMFLQVARNGGAIDTGLHYTWVTNNVSCTDGGVTATLLSGNAAGRDPFWQAGATTSGTTGTDWMSNGIIWIYYYPESRQSRAFWDYLSVDTARINRASGSGYHNATPGPLTKLNFSSGFLFATGTTFDLFVAK